MSNFTVGTCDRIKISSGMDQLQRWGRPEKHTIIRAVAANLRNFGCKVTQVRDVSTENAFFGIRDILSNNPNLIFKPNLVLN